jgi:hypothetical protein
VQSGLPHRDRHHLDWIALGLLLATAALLLAGLQHLQNPTGDSVRFLGLADALLQDGRYEFNSRPHTRFPPGYPALLALLSALLGESYSVAITSVALQAVLALAVGYWVLRAAGRPLLGVFSIVLIASSPYFFERATRTVASDFAYMVASFAALLIAQHLAVARSRSQLGTSAALSIAVLLAISLRSLGLALWAALALTLAVPAWRRHLASNSI